MDINEVFAKIGFDGKMFLFNVVNFLVILLVLRKFFFKKIFDALDARQAKIQEGLDDAEKYKHELKMAEQLSAEIVDKAKHDGTEIIMNSKKEAELLATNIKNQAQDDISELEQKSREQIELERKQMIASLKKETADLAIMATEKIIKEKLDKKRDREIIDSYLDQLEEK